MLLLQNFNRLSVTIDIGLQLARMFVVGDVEVELTIAG